jgi:hypothetical protein
MRAKEQKQREKEQKNKKKEKTLFFVLETALNGDRVALWS